mmetsp:Transcript_24857/g.69286  ORF Transcript_24857/g.69286 Transcript_24857/m.69286 type:complete len:323 (+) Transcript_24857:914-1882(+)
MHVSGLRRQSIRHSNPRSFVGTTCYCAPEILQAQHQEFPYSGELSDVWSMGVMLYLMVCGKLPFGAGDGASHAVMARVVKGEYDIPHSVQLSEGCMSLLSSILVVDPTQRIRLESIWQHPWMREGGIEKAALADEGIMSSQSDENITSLCLEALNQDEDGIPTAASTAALPGPQNSSPHPPEGEAHARDQGTAEAGSLGKEEEEEDMDDLLMDDEELSNIIHMDDAPHDDFSSIIHMGTEDCPPFLESEAGAGLEDPQQDVFGEMMRMTSDMSIGPCAFSGMSTEGLLSMAANDLPSQQDIDVLDLLTVPDVGNAATAHPHK